MSTPRLEMTTTPAFQAFADHLAHCTQGCDVRLDGTGPLCDQGQALSAVDWELELAVPSGAVAYANDRARVIRDAVSGSRAGRADARRAVVSAPEGVPE